MKIVELMLVIVFETDKLVVPITKLSCILEQKSILNDAISTGAPYDCFTIITHIFSCLVLFSFPFIDFIFTFTM